MDVVEVDNGLNCLTQPMVQVWSGLFKRAFEKKRKFTERGRQVECFYSGDPGFMWKPDYISAYMNGSGAFKTPKFGITINKAFEFVALMGPMLFWQMADRSVKPYRPIDFDITTLAGNDPVRMEFLSRVQTAQAETNAISELRSEVQERVLNYLPRVQPHGGLVTHAGMAVFDALLKGIGFLSTEPYKFPGADRKLVGSFWVAVDDVLVDPDCKSPLWDDANWVAIRHRHKYFEVEQYFGLPAGSMRKYCSDSTEGAKWNKDLPLESGPQTTERESKDIVVWFEVYSKAGCGNKLAAPNIQIQQEFDHDAGDFAYLCICPLCPYPLNLPSSELGGEDVDSEFIRERLRWPTEYWRDNKWPLNKLLFYPHSDRSPWPEPPLAPALGELTVLNILISAYVQTVYDNRQQLLAVFENMCDNLQEIVNSSTSPAIITLKPGIQKSINDVLQFMNRPEVNKDVPKTIEFLLALFEQRTGMSQILYGQGGESNSRSAAEYTGRRETVNIRPDYMRKKVGEWMSETAAKELFAVYSHMGTADVADILGPLGTVAWEELVQNESAEVVLRSSECHVEASDIGRPNHERDTQLLKEMQQYVLPVLAGYMNQTGDPGPYNGFVNTLGRVSNLDVRTFEIPAPATPDEQAQRAQQYQQQLEVQRLQAEVAKMNAEARRSDAESQAIGARVETDRQIAQAKIWQAMQTGQSKQEEQQFRMINAQQAAELKQQTALQAAGLKSQTAQQAADLRNRMSMQDAMLKQQAAEHQAQIRERDAATKAQVAEHQISLQERAADAQAMTTAMQSAAQQDAAESAAASQALNQQMATERHIQDMQQKEQAAKQKFVLDLMSKAHGMELAEAGHQQQSQLLDQKASDDARRANMINNNRLLMAAAQAAQREKIQKSQTKA